MAKRIIVLHPDSILRETAIAVRNFNANVHRLLDDMRETMIDAQGVGLAAPQVGISKRIAIVEVDEESGLIEMINPQIVAKEGEQLGPEGCLSIPHLLGDVRRYEWIKVKALNRQGEPFEFEAEDLLAVAVQHEIDHLNGVLFLDIAEKVYHKNELATEGSEGDQH